MTLPKTPDGGIDLDEFARQLREFESLRVKSSTVGARENGRTVGGKNPKSDRESPRHQPARASSVHPRQNSMKGSAKKANVDDVERPLRDRKSPAPPKKSGFLVTRDKKPGGTTGRPINVDAKATAGATSHLGLMKDSWRPVILQTYGE